MRYPIYARTLLNFRSFDHTLTIEADTTKKRMASSQSSTQELVDISRRSIEDMEIYSGSLPMENLRIVAEELHVTSVIDTNMTSLDFFHKEMRLIDEQVVTVNASLNVPIVAISSTPTESIEPLTSTKEEKQALTQAFTDQVLLAVRGLRHQFPMRQTVQWHIEFAPDHAHSVIVNVRINPQV